MFVNAFATGIYLVLGPVVAKEELGGAAAWGLILGTSAAGMVIGGLLVLHFRPARMLLVATLVIFLQVPTLVLLALPAPLVVIAVAALATGIGHEVFGVLWDTSLQQQIPHDVLSRVYSYDALGSFVCIPIGMSVAGPIADAVGVRGALLLAGAVVVAATVPVLCVHDVRHLRRTDEPARLGPEPPLATQPEPDVAPLHAEG
jgi:hypothetical protein